jgi:hypothetical protein
VHVEWTLILQCHREVCRELPHALASFANAGVISVAEIAEMPLYSVTCGDIGTKPEDVEKYLQTIFYLGKEWNCGA